VKLPNRQNAIIEPTKLRDYLLNPNHRRGGSKSRLLMQYGYYADNWQQLELDIRQYHLDAEVEVIRETSYGFRYEILGTLLTPIGEELTLRSV
jgi:hypothetical protein